MADRDDCLYGIGMSASAVLLALDPNNVLVAGCDVKRGRNPCPECAMNNDCTVIPLHPNCECEAEPFLLGAGN
jgi:hypothetical protein